jgi:hypothetical protein
MRLEILLTFLLFYVGAFFSGIMLCKILHLKKGEPVCAIISGVVVWWAVMELLLVPMTMFLQSFRCFTIIYSAIILGMVLTGICFYREYFVSDIKNLKSSIRAYITPGHITALILMLWQLYFIHHHMYLEWDDTYYVNIANEAVVSDKIYWVYPETGTMADFDKRYVLSLWPIFYAWLSKLIGVSPTIMAHTIFPWLMIPLAYMVYFMISKEWFSDDRQMQGMFLTFAVLLHMFMSGTHTSGITFLSITPWVGKGVLAAILIPELFYVFLRCANRDETGNWVLLGISCLGSCLLSSMGIMLIPILTGLMSLLTASQKRDFRYLYKGIAACVPCVLLGIYYIYLTH